MIDLTWLLSEAAANSVWALVLVVVLALGGRGAWIFGSYHREMIAYRDQRIAEMAAEIREWRALAKAATETNERFARTAEQFRLTAVRSNAARELPAREQEREREVDA